MAEGMLQHERHDAVTATYTMCRKYDNVKRIVDQVKDSFFSLVNTKRELHNFSTTSKSNDQRGADTQYFADNLEWIGSHLELIDADDTPSDSKTVSLMYDIRQSAQNNFEVCWCVIWNEPLLWSMALHGIHSIMLTSDNVILLAVSALQTGGWRLFENILTKGRIGPIPAWPDTLVEAYVHAVVQNHGSMFERMSTIFVIDSTFYYQVVDRISLAYLENNLDEKYKVSPYLMTRDEPREYPKSMIFLLREAAVDNAATAAAADVDDVDADGDGDADVDAFAEGTSGHANSFDPNPLEIRVLHWYKEYFQDYLTIFTTLTRFASEIPINWKYRRVFKSAMDRAIHNIYLPTQQQPLWIILEVLLRLDMWEMARGCLSNIHSSDDLQLTNPAAFPKDTLYLVYLLKGLSKELVSAHFLAKVFAFGQYRNKDVVGQHRICDTHQFLKEVTTGNKVTYDDFIAALHRVLFDQKNMCYWQMTTIPVMRSILNNDNNHNADDDDDHFHWVDRYESMENKHKFLSLLRAQLYWPDALMSEWGYDQDLWNELDGLYNLFHLAVPYDESYCYSRERHGFVRPEQVKKTLPALVPYMLMAVTDAKTEAQNMFSRSQGITAQPAVIMFLTYVASGLPISESAERARSLAKYMGNFDIRCDGQVWLFLDPEEQLQGVAKNKS